MQRKWVSMWSGSGLRAGRVLLGAALFAVTACKSAGSASGPRASEAAEASTERCQGNLRSAQRRVRYQVGCDGLSTRMQCAYQGARVEFTSDCDQQVELYFSEPETLFTSKTASIVLKSKGDSRTETVGSDGGNHCVCVGDALCGSDACFQFGRESKTGSLDVYTSGPGDDGENKPR
jgi:hypothetical protein